MSENVGNSGLYDELTAQILEALKKGVAPWRRPWRTFMPPTRYAGLPFTGTNRLILSLAADRKEYTSPFWLTAAQGRSCGAKVLDGEKGTRVARPLPFFVPDSSLPVMESYEVFNGEQFDRLPPRFRVDEENAAAGARISFAEDFFGAAGAKIVHGGDRAAYNIGEDLIKMPPFSSFLDAPSYYSTLAHEAIHWTGHRSRMNRGFGTRFGYKAYAFEELVAELGAAFVMGHLRLPCRVEQDHAPYIDSWIEVLENDTKAIHVAATHAQRATDFLIISAASCRVPELLERRLDNCDWLVVYLDVVKIGPHPLLGAVGVDVDGAKRVLGLCHAESDPATWTTATKLLRDVMDRGLRPPRRLLVVTDGSVPLKDAVRATFGGDTLVQACRRHFEREVASRLRGKKDRGKDRKALRAAWSDGAEEGPHPWQPLAMQLEQTGWDAAASLLNAGSSDLFTVDRLGLDEELTKSLVTTSVIDRASSGLSRQICGVPTWAERDTALTWAAVSFLQSERGYRKIRGHRHLDRLKEHLGAGRALAP